MAKTAKKKTTKKTVTKKTTKKVARGKRYTTEEKSKVVEFVHQANSPKGRGGVAAAAREFGITALTIASWVKKGGLGKSPAAKTVARSKGVATGREGVLSELVDLQKKITRAQTELQEMEARFETLKGAL